jgi:hypothetical protein
LGFAIVGANPRLNDGLLEIDIDFPVTNKSGGGGLDRSDEGPAGVEYIVGRPDGV